MTQVAKSYLELVGLLFILLTLWDQQALRILLDGGWFSGNLDAGTVRSAWVSGVLVRLYVRELSVIYCKALIARSCSSSIENYNNRDGFLPPQPDPLLRGRQCRWRKNLGRESYVGRILLILSLSERKFLVHTWCIICGDLVQGQCTMPRLHNWQRFTDPLDPQK